MYFVLLAKFVPVLVQFAYASFASSPSPYWEKFVVHSPRLLCRVVKAMKAEK
jgi:hypothetical protein